MSASPRFVAALLWGSGFCALLYQTAWQRSLRLVFGASTAASAAVLAIFLGGLGVGGLFLGRRAERHARPLLFYGNLELGVALAAALSPFSMAALGRGYLALGGVTSLGQTLSTLARLAITAIAIGPGAVLMGGTLPAAARAVEAEGDRARARLALLYGANTLGAVGGALFGTFVLFEVFGTRVSLWIAALVNLLVGVIARALGRTAAEIRDPAEPAAPEDPARAEAMLACVVAGGVGFAFLLLEIVWYRLLAPILGGSTYTFGLVLALALAGIGVGGFLYSRRDGDRAVHASDLALVTMLEGVLVAVPLALGDRIALYAVLTRPLGSLGFSALVFGWAAVTAVVVLPAAIVAGYQFPLLFALLGPGRRKVAEHVGLLYALNTVGALLGSLLGGFVLIPRLGAVGCFRLVAWLLLVLGLLSLGVELLRSLRRAASTLPLVLALGLCLVALVTRTGPTAVWRHLPIGAGRVESPGRTINDYRAWRAVQNEAVLFQADGVETSVAMTTGEQLAFVVDGKSDGAVYTDRATQAGSGLIAALLHPAPKRSLVIGLGTGMTAGVLSVVPDMEHVDVAELEPAIREVARVAAVANQNVLSRPNVTVHFGDGRELVLSAKNGYDVIASEPSNPYRAGVASLYTREFYEAVAAHLRDGGVFVQWVQGYETDADTIRLVARTLRSVLSSVEAWQTEYGDILFVASREHRVLEADRLRQRIAEEPYRSAFPRTLLIQDLEGLLARHVANDTALAEISSDPGIVINTDDRNAIEYAYARSVGSAKGGVSDRLLGRAMKRAEDRPDVRGSVDWARVAELRPRAWLVTGASPRALPMPTASARARSDAVTLGCLGDAGRALAAWEAAPDRAEPRDDIERFVLGMGLADRGDDRAAAYADGLASRGFEVEAGILRARLLLGRGDAASAMEATFGAMDALRRLPFPLCAAAKEVLSLVAEGVKRNPANVRRTVLALVDRPFATYLVDDERLALAQRLAASSGDAALCVKALGRRAKDPLWDGGFLRARLRCLAAAKDPRAEQAAADLVQFESATSGDFEALEP